MKVIDLIIQLQKINPEMDVMFDITKEGATMFHFVSIDNVEEAELPDGKNICTLESYCPENQPNDN